MYKSTHMLFFSFYTRGSLKNVVNTGGYHHVNAEAELQLLQSEYQ